MLETSGKWIPLMELLEKTELREPSIVFGTIKQIQYLNPNFYLQKTEGNEIYIGLEGAENLNSL